MPDFDFERAMEEGWQGALRIIREQGDCPEKVIEEAALQCRHELPLPEVTNGPNTTHRK